MTDEEIKAVVTDTPSAFKRTDPAPAKSAPPMTASEAAWDAVQRLGTQVDAARELGVKQGSIQSGLKAYMKAHGLEGPLPGKLTTEQIHARRRAERAAASVRASIPTEKVDIADEGATDIAELAAAEAVPVHPSTPLAQAFEAAAEQARVKSAMQPSRASQAPVALIVHQDGEAHARSYNEGYDDGFRDATAPRSTRDLELTDAQAAHVLRGLMPVGNERIVDPLMFSQAIIRELHELGYDLVIRLVPAVAA